MNIHEPKLTGSPHNVLSNLLLYLQDLKQYQIIH
jgi:hypothetical protein